MNITVGHRPWPGRLLVRLERLNELDVGGHCVAIVDRHKIVDYLLNSRHPDNGGKAQFFESLGSPLRIQRLSSALFAQWLRPAKSSRIWNPPTANNMLSTAWCRRKLRRDIRG